LIGAQSRKTNGVGFRVAWGWEKADPEAVHELDRLKRSSFSRRSERSSRSTEAVLTACFSLVSDRPLRHLNALKRSGFIRCSERFSRLTEGVLTASCFSW
jgi:hypothetical protein